MSTTTAAVPQQSPSSLRTNLEYIVRGGKSSLHPASLRTRSTLNTVRYVGKFIFWRLLRYLKYAVVGAGVAALGGTVLGTALPWVSMLVLPSIPVAAAMGVTTAAIKFGWRHRGNHFRQGWIHGGEGRDARDDERNDAEEAEAEFSRPTVNPRAAKAWGYA